MNSTEVKLLPTNVSIGSDANVLQDIHLPNKNITIYQRNIKSWQEDLNRLAEDSFRYQAGGTIVEIMDYLKAYFNQNHPGYDFLMKDIIAHLQHFSKITKATTFRILLATIDTNMCSKFHTDINDLRLLCTYAGPGTLWLSEEGENPGYDKNRDAVICEDDIQQVDTGDVAILKGALYPNAEGVMHKSPAIEKTDEKRLLLRIDTNETLKLWT